MDKQRSLFIDSTFYPTWGGKVKLELGRGGMAMCHLALVTRLNRSVATKVLPSTLVPRHFFEFAIKPYPFGLVRVTVWASNSE